MYRAKKNSPQHHVPTSAVGEVNACVSRHMHRYIYIMDLKPSSQTGYSGYESTHVRFFYYDSRAFLVVARFLWENENPTMA